APIVADLAHEAGILTVGVVTKPFKFEGANRMRQAEQGIADLNGKVDSLIIIPNDRLKYVTDQKITFANAFGIADDVLKQAVTSISELVGFCKNVIINLDFADVSAVMKDAGRAHMGVGTASGREKAEQAATAAVSSPLLETSINGATGVLVNVTGSSEMTLDDVETAAGIVQEAANPEANIIFGATIADDFQDEMRVTVIATGFEMKPEASSFAPRAAAPQSKPSAPSFVPEDIDTPVAASKQPTKPADMSDIDEIFSIFKR
ncbi:MAG: cell division protein FtsZ, partial [Clostridiales bacterium]|nr:cell division protein FtsZ [Clostridiales bacterium]